MNMICLGIESTAHTFGVGIVQSDDNEKIEVLANERVIYKPDANKGIKPDDAGKHHIENSMIILENALKKAGLTLDNIDIVSFSAGPGLPPCLRAGVELVKKLGKSAIPVNHCIAHIEIAKWATGLNDPVTLYVSGGNTQIIAFAGGRYRVFGETLDIAIGNAIDKFMRETGHDFPGGPIMDRNWKEIADLSDTENHYIELPYTVKGMDMSFSGLLISAIRKHKENPTDENFKNICFSFEETAFAMLTEVTERAMAHTGKTECVVTGGVAASERLKNMLGIMCKERGDVFAACPREYAGDNGAMIALTGLIYHRRGQKTIDPMKADFNTRWRTDDVDVIE
ncbi:MAG: KEOPS complex N(6)-L-threonylcarbamoyladenine synthase Kae1 [Candidatus Aenigmatarchaeota archaeon]